MDSKADKAFEVTGDSEISDDNGIKARSDDSIEVRSVSSKTTNGAPAGEDSKPTDDKVETPDVLETRHVVEEADEEADEAEVPPPPYSVFTKNQKRCMVLAASLTAFFSPLSAQIYLPALEEIANDLNVTSSQINLTITTYMLLQGLTPMILGSLADSGGRRPAYITCFVIYIGANIGLALAPNYGAVLGLRCLQSAGSSSTVALCTAVVADIVTSAERGQYIGYTVIAGVLGPALGPVIGGLLSESLGWRSIFWFLAIFAGVTLLLHALLFPETCRQIVGDGSVDPPLIYQTPAHIVRRRHRRKQTRVGDPDLERQTSRASGFERDFKFKPPNIIGSLLMLFELDTFVLLGTSSIAFAGFYCIATAMPSLFADRYGYNEIETGLMYLPLAAGAAVAAVAAGPLINWNFKRHCARLDIPLDRSRQQSLIDFPVEQARLQIGIPLLLLAGVALIGWGWAMNSYVHVAVPSVISAFVGFGMIGFSNTVNILLVETHVGKAGAATAANNLTRCLLGAGATAAIAPLMSTIGVGWAFTLVGGLYFFCAPVLVLLMKKGNSWRRERQKNSEAAAKAQEARSHRA